MLFCLDSIECNYKSHAGMKVNETSGSIKLITHNYITTTTFFKKQKPAKKAVIKKAKSKAKK